MNKNNFTDEQLEAYQALTPLQRDIACNTLAGMSKLEAYNNSKGKAKSDEAKIAGVKEILRNPTVDKFMTSMQKKMVENTGQTADKLLGELDEIKTLALGDSQYSPSVAAVMGKAKILGLDKHDVNVNVSGSVMTYTPDDYQKAQSILNDEYS